MNKFKVGDKIRSTLGRLTYTILYVGINAYFTEYETETGGKYNTTISNEASFELYVPEPCVGDRYYHKGGPDFQLKIIAIHGNCIWMLRNWNDSCATYSLDQVNKMSKFPI